jgi:pyrroloquinoline quinone biosynthesis protein B
MEESLVEILLLGAAQDAGFPQSGCACDNCVAARQDSQKVEYPSSIAIIHHGEKCFWIVDATPAFPSQLEMVKERTKDYEFCGIFITHAHMGHYTGLMFLGKEVMNAHEIPVYVSALVGEFLSGNAPWSPLIEQRNIVLHTIEEDQPLQIAPETSVTGYFVPHRDEFADTFSFVIRGANRSLFYCPDIDRWELWQYDLRTFLTTIDVALVDGTFYSADELPEDRISKVPHPTVMSSCERLEEISGKVTFIHMNHTNPLYKEGKEKARVLESGFGVGRRGQYWKL